MKTFVILGISAAVCDVFYAPCTAMGKRDPIPLSPYVCAMSLLDIYYSFQPFPNTYILIIEWYCIL